MLCYSTSCDVTVGPSLLKVVYTFKHQPPFVSILSRLVPSLSNPEIERKRQSVQTLLPDFPADERRAVACFLPGNSMVLSSVRAISVVELTSDKHVALPSSHSLTTQHFRFADAYVKLLLIYCRRCNTVSDIMKIA